jgi:hypothetical protein
MKEEHKTKVTSIRMYPNLWKKFKIYCLMNNIEASDEVCKMIAERIKKHNLLLNKLVKMKLE